jgi:hypothetical protein
MSPAAHRGVEPWRSDGDDIAVLMPKASYCGVEPVGAVEVRSDRLGVHWLLR